ncbi:MAG: sigma-70 family RNA polymerase sigma factor [Deltaproteobacteria bacterium]|nr:sigma-70 family RNA polymerase sigma factor [Deltaproteobacteria bacterium]
MAESDAILERYIERVRAIPKLTREREHEIALLARDGDEGARGELIEANLRYAVAVALQYRRYRIRLGDLISEANLGLVTAVSKFDPSRGTRFVTYAGYWIRAFVLEAVVRSTTLVGAGSGPLRSKLFFRLRRERARLSGLVRDADELHERLAVRFEVTPERMREMLRRVEGRDLSLDTPTRDDANTTLLDNLVHPSESHEELVGRHMKNEAVRAQLGPALSSLDARERFIVEQRLLADEGASLASLGRTLGVSRERARQLEARAKRKLATRLSAFAPAA